MSVRSLLLGLLAFVILPVDAAEPAFPDTLSVRYHVMVPMRDSVRLATDVYLPGDDGPYPTLFVRDMYGNGSAGVRQRYARWATANGYAFVIQNVRGRFDSEGHWYPYFQEIADGGDTISWIADQPWSNGKVGMFGTSYLASVQWLAALNAQPELVAIAPAMSPGNYYRDVAYPGGAFSLLSRAGWGMGVAAYRTNGGFPIRWEEEIDHLPLETLGPSLGFDVRHFQDWLAHPTYDAYWRPLDLEARADEMRVPALNIGGWYDVFLRSTIGSYVTMRKEAMTQEARDGQRLIIGPWPHGWNQSTTTGEVDFGADALIDAEGIQLAWFDHWLKGKPLPEMAPVRIFVMGANEWRDEQDWPLERTEYTPWYLHAGGGLGPEPPAADAEPMRYRYDPANPVPTLGGNIMRPTLRGAFDQTPLDDREDVLRFVSEPVEGPMEITGPVRAVLYAASSAPDTDFMAKLIVVKPDGRAINLVDGVLRARFREGFEREVFLEPGEVTRFDIDLWATSYRLSAGDRLRVDVTSSNYPRLARNLNTGAPFAKTSAMKVARQTVHMSEGQASHVVLPIIPLEAP
ncbi:MAG: CocE/NonD family hydrolase [Pseudomonadales bacterium]|jgi:putative CocE/NonD family hydrolase|nr:CocE/NonD family hydrolase [Pseudomonadales bacterium]